ncbi:MAG: urea ABC transporter permease subunit UrtB [Roseimicrobium sp.]
MSRPHLLILVSLLSWGAVRATLDAQDAEAKTRQVIARALTTADVAEQASLVRALAADGGPVAAEILQQWKEGSIFLYKDSAGKSVPVTLGEPKDASGKQPAFLVESELPLQDATGTPLSLSAASLETAETTSALRKAMKDVIDMAGISDPDPKQRLKAVQKVGLEQSLTKLPPLQARLAIEGDAAVLRMLREAIALTQLRSTEISARIEACETLGDLASITAQDALKTILAEAEKANQPEVAKAAKNALAAIAGHVAVVNTIGTMFRGLSLGSILLVVAIGLAITFGLMGVINMAHGELIVVGAYTTYVVQKIFSTGLALSPLGLSINLPGMGLTGAAYDCYFIFALPLSFLMAALVGIGLERCVIQFLYRRPLESLLATWGVSLVLQQVFRLIFGANNVQVDSPAWLSGNWTVNDIIFGWNRVFVIGFAVLIIALIWAALNKTPLGQLIRAVMQNRNMAACMGVRTERVNMLTFGLGSGLAGLAGAFLSQIGNVGPSLGQSYIVDAFMTVVVGGVGNIMGTVISALGIGVVDQALQQILGNPVLGKILVLGAIILFLQWKPAGIFVTRSRSLES